MHRGLRHFSKVPPSAFQGPRGRWKRQGVDDRSPSYQPVGIVAKFVGANILSVPQRSALPRPSGWNRFSQGVQVHEKRPDG